MGNPYPAVLIDANELTRAGVEIDFTDPGNQPGSGGGQLLTLAEVGFDGENAPAWYGNFAVLLDGVGLTGRVEAAVTSMPLLIAAMSPVVQLPIAAVTQIPDSTDIYDLVASWTVTNMTGTQIIQIVAVFNAAAHTPASTADWATATPTAIAGADLTYDGPSQVVSSTAGGVFVSTMNIRGGWD